MLSMRKANEKDLSFWTSLDCHIDNAVLKGKLPLNECFVIVSDEEDVGVLRYNLFWDNTPFLNMIYLKDDCRRKGIGSYAITEWEKHMKAMGFIAVMTSTQSDEQAQHFYRKMGYKDCGCLLLDVPGMEQPTELFFIKSL